MTITIFWFRRDLRLHDNHGLYQALTQAENIVPLFIFDKEILNELPKKDARVTFIYQELEKLKKQLNEAGGELITRYGNPEDVWKKLTKEFEIDAVYTNHDYEPYARDRDESVRKIVKKENIEWHTFKDHVLFEKDEIKTDAGGIYTVFTPYKKKWLEAFKEQYLDKAKNNRSFYPSEDHFDALAKIESEDLISLEEMGFERTERTFPDKEVSKSVIKNYAERRNFPALDNGTSRLGIHFRFGTISIREKAIKAANLSEVFLSELIWRDFYSQILANYPHVVTESFRSKYDKIPWRDDSGDFEAWCNGMTGYPIVDAGMRQLNKSGYMHNRVRMITASFLTKHLLIDWRKGEAYFAKKLLDYDLASNNGGWQWAAGSGTDAAPYFRIFNPTSQMEKFDKDKKYIREWIEEFDTDDYPEPIVEHKFARQRCLDTYKEALSDD